MAPSERPRVKLECLRLLASLKLDPARSKLIGGFIDSYLTLSGQEMAQYERELQTLDTVEQESTMELISSWERRGIEKGKEELLTVMLEQRFSTLPGDLTEHLDNLSSEQLNELGKAVWNFQSLDDLTAWLAEHE